MDTIKRFLKSAIGILIPLYMYIGLLYVEIYAFSTPYIRLVQGALLIAWFTIFLSVRFVLQRVVLDFGKKQFRSQPVALTFAIVSTVFWTMVSYHEIIMSTTNSLLKYSGFYYRDIAIVTDEVFWRLPISYSVVALLILIYYEASQYYSDW